jgi:hypothetical protein
MADRGAVEVILPIAALSRKPTLAPFPSLFMDNNLP